jgi:CRP-like cAMP-binding protein
MTHPLRQHIEKITPISNEEFEYILSHFSLKKLKKHQFLIQEGDTSITMCYVLKGCLKSYQVGTDDKEHIVYFAFADWWISDFYAFYNQEKATLTIDCIEETELLCISFENREKLCSELHKIEYFFRKKTNTGYGALQNRILSLLDTNIKERYNNLLKMYPELFQKVPKHLIASYLGVSRETLSRLKKDS